ncbi:tyrosine-type recombinase/integrase [Oxalobacteraceae bacterium A2-2]
MSVDVFKVGAIWHYRFQVRPFPRIQRSTRLRNKRAAEAVATAAYLHAVERANGGQPIPTLAQLLADWMKLHAPHCSDHHVRSVEIFGRLHMHGLADTLISELDTTTVERARIEHLQTHNHASTNHWLRVLKLLVSWAVRRKILARLPWDVAMLKVQKRPRVMLPVSAASTWFAAVDRAAGRATGIGVAARLLLLLGLRESEAISARWEWIDWERRTYTPGKTKGKEADPLPMLDWLVDYLRPLRQAEGLIVCRADGSAFGSGFMRAAIRAANAACATKGITPHRLRGTIATWLSENGVPVQDVQAFLRHKDVRTTMAYLEKSMGRVVKSQREIAINIGLTGRENGEHHPANPHES